MRRGSFWPHNPPNQSSLVRQLTPPLKKVVRLLTQTTPTPTQDMVRMGRQEGKGGDGVRDRRMGSCYLEKKGGGQRRKERERCSLKTLLSS